MKVELSKDEMKLLVKSIQTRIGFIENERLPIMTTDKYIEEEKAEITRLNVIKVYLQEKVQKAV
jgi:hypothetical protein